MRRAARQILLNVYAFLAVIAPGLLVAQGRALSEFHHTAWTVENGAPARIQRLAQTKDGFLWMATPTGLFRFDGVTFEAYQPPHDQHLLHTSIQSLTATDDGGLWIGYALGDTSFLKGGVIVNHIFRGHVHRASGAVTYIVVRRDGSTWASTNNGLIHLVSGEWEDADEVQGLGVKSSYKLYEDDRRTLWMATEYFVYRLPYGASKFEKTELHPGPNGQFIETLDHTVWIADEYGLHDVEDPFAKKAHFPLIDVPLDLSIDDSGALWFIGAKTGVTRIAQPSDTAKLRVADQQKILENYSAKEGLTSEVGSKALKDREGNMWVATTNGLDRFRRTALKPASLPDKFYHFALAPEPDGSILIGTSLLGVQRVASGKATYVPTGNSFEISCLYRAPDGKLWIGGVGFLGYLDGDHYVDVPIPAEVRAPPLRETQALTIGLDGDLWMQTNSLLGIYRLHGGQWSPVANTTDKGLAVVMVTDGVGRIWAGFMTGFVTIFDRTKRTTIGSDQGLALGGILSFLPSGDGMWIGGERGLAIMIGDRPVGLKFAGEPQIGGISGIARMEDGSMWLNSLQGVLRVPSDEVAQSLKDPSHAMHYRLFNRLDGLLGNPQQINPMPSILRGLENTLWFTTTNGVYSVDTAHILTNLIVPPVVIKDVIVDGQVLSADNAHTLSKGAKDLQIDYTALSLSIPERVRFRYRLEGYDKDWRDAGTRRQAFYNDLPPGHYIFRVIACNNDGIWNNAGAKTSLYLPPTFLQGWTFKVLLVTSILLIVWVIYLLRMKQETSKVQVRMFERFSERERIARELHDTLFQSVEGGLYLINSVTSRLAMEAAERERLQGAFHEIDQVVAATRSLIFSQGTVAGSLSLEGAVAAYGEQLGFLSESRFTLSATGIKQPMQLAACEELLKIIKEAIANAFRHAVASEIEVRVNYTRSALEVSVNDDGIGIDPAILEQGGRPGHWGLSSMYQRASRLGGRLSVIRREGGGTEVRVMVPARRVFRSAVFDFASKFLGTNKTS